MKLKSLNSPYNNRNVFLNEHCNLLQNKCKRNKIKDNDGFYNTNRPAQAISFSGSASSSAQKAAKGLADKFIESNTINKLVFAINNNEVAFNAIYSLIIAGILKPSLVLAQTGFDDKDGQMIATKNFLQAFVGSFLGFTVGGKFIKNIYDKMDYNLRLLKLNQNGNLEVADIDSAKSVAKDVLMHENSKFKDKWQNAKMMASKEEGFSKIKAFFSGIQKTNYKPTEIELEAKAKELIDNFKAGAHFELLTKKNPEFTKRLVSNMELINLNPSEAKRVLKHGSQLYDSFESLWKNSTGALTSVAKAKISSMFLPAVVAFLFAKKSLEKEMAENKNVGNFDSVLLNSNKFKQENLKFENILNSKTNNNAINFKGKNLDAAIDYSAYIVEKLAMSKGGEKCTDFLSKYVKKPSARMQDVESIGITIYWLLSTHLSKKIDPDQKFGLNAHTALVTLLSSISALVIDSVSDGLINKAEDAYINKINQVADEAKAALKNNDTEKSFEKIISDGCSKLYSSKDVIEKLSNKELLINNEENLKNVIGGLSYKYAKKLSKAKSLLVFTLVVRFLVPVLTVKASKRLKKKLIELTKKRNDNKNNLKTQNA